MKDRIKLADAMKIPYWRSEVYGDAIGVPDPFTDANDCDALIRHLNGLGQWVIINHHNTKRGGSNIKMGKGISDPAYDWDGDDWKTGVCELALKVLETTVPADPESGSD